MKRILCLILSVLILTATPLLMLSCSKKEETTKADVTEAQKETEVTGEAEDTVNKKDDGDIDTDAPVRTGTDYSQPKGAGNIKKLDNIDSRTILIYIVGSDLESNYGSATSDLIEMQDADIDTDKNNVVVYAGGTYQWQNDLIDASEDTILTLEDGSFAIAETMPSRNMGDSSTLSDFIKYGLENFESDSYSLILWDHGSGPIEGYGLDEVSCDLLYLSEIGKALYDSGIGIDKKFEFIGFDACLMSSVEVAWMLRNYAEYFIASQEVEPGEGWDYSFLSDLDECRDPEALGRCIVDHYYDTTYGYYGNFCDITLSLMDLSVTEELESSLNTLFAKVMAQDDFNDLSRTVQSTHFYYPDAYLDLMDVTHFATLLSSSYGSEADALVNKLDEFVLYNRSNVDNSYGVSIYHPYYNTYYASEYLKIYADWSFAQDYQDYIGYFVGRMSGGGSSNGDSVDWLDFLISIFTRDDGVNGRDFSIQLDSEQTDAYASSKYYILKKVARNKYIFIFSGNDADLDSEGRLNATYEGKAVYGLDTNTDTLSEVPLSMYQHSDDTYYIPVIFFDTDSLESVNALWRIEIVDGEVISRTALPVTENGLPAKQYIDVSDYDYVHISTAAKKYTENENGTPAPYEAWTETDTVYFSEYMTDDSFEIGMLDIELNDDYYVFFEITDVYGNVYTTDLTEIK